MLFCRVPSDNHPDIPNGGYALVLNNDFKL